MIVTGGRGFIGTNLIEKVGGDSYDVKDSLDIRRVWQVKEHLLSDVVHLAALPGIPASIERPSLSHDINTTGTLNVLEAARENKVKVILASSAAAENCQTPYAACKRSNEIYANAYHETYGLEYTALRFANVYGPHSLHKKSVIAQMCKDALTNGVISVYGETERDFIYIDDVIRAIVGALNNNYSGVLNVGTGTTTSIKDIAHIIAKETGAEVVQRKPREGDVPSSSMDISETKKAIDWEPHIEVRVGIMKTLDWFRREIRGDY